MPVVIVEMLEGQEADKKKQLVKDITRAFENIGVPASGVNIILKENPKRCWAVDGQFCSDFKIPEWA
jgi:4-oxalocrotonate tautomerase family enzyme